MEDLKTRALKHVKDFLDWLRDMGLTLQSVIDRIPDSATDALTATFPKLIEAAGGVITKVFGLFNETRALRDAAIATGFTKLIEGLGTAVDAVAHVVDNSTFVQGVMRSPTQRSASPERWHSRRWERW